MYYIRTYLFLLIAWVRRLLFFLYSLFFIILPFDTTFFVQERRLGYLMKASTSTALMFLITKSGQTFVSGYSYSDLTSA